MRNCLMVFLGVGLAGMLACGSSDGTVVSGDIDLVADAVVADEGISADTSVADDSSRTDLVSVDDNVQPDVPVTVDTVVTDTVLTDAADVPKSFEWDASATPNCVDGFCAAGVDSAPDPMQPGPFPVGLRRIVMEDPSQKNYDGTPRMLVTEIWYPTTKEFYDSHPKFEYDIKADAMLTPGYEDLAAKIGDIDVGTFPVDAVKDAPVRHGDGRFPLVMFSHGAFGIRYQSIFYTVPLASHGYIVVSPDHEKNSLYDLIQSGYSGDHLGDSAFARPKDIQFLMNKMVDWDKDPTNDFYKSIESDNVGITGHSFGGYTCFAATYFADENGFSEMDPRVKVIVPQAPAGYLMGVLGIYGPDWHLPTLIEGGEMDNTLEFDQAFKSPWLELGTPKWFLDIKRGGHFTFSDLCKLNLLEVADKLGYDDAKNALTDGCGPDNWDYREAQKAINLYSIAAFNRVLRHSEVSAKYMTPSAGAGFAPEIEFLVEEQTMAAK